MRGRLPVEIDSGEKQIRIVNNRQLYEFIKSGKAPVLLGTLWAYIRSVSETIEPGYGPLTLLFEAFVLYHLCDYSLVHLRAVRVTGKWPSHTAV